MTNSITVTVNHGAGNSIPVEIDEGSTTSNLLSNSTVVAVCGAHNAARIGGVVTPNDVILQDGDVVEPFTSANEKGARVCVTVTHGAGNEIPVEIDEESTVHNLLSNSTVVAVCGQHNAARIGGVVTPNDVILQDGDIVEPFTSANEKGLDQ